MSRQRDLLASVVQVAIPLLPLRLGFSILAKSAKDTQYNHETETP